MKRSKRKNEIYSAAVELFKERGYAAASMRDVADKVGLEVSSLYSHISSKEEILKDICLECSDMFHRGMQEILDRKTTSKSKIKALIQLHIDIAVHHPSSATVFNDEWKHLPTESLHMFLDSRRKYEASFRDLLRAGMEEGTFTKRSTKVVFNIIINSTKWLFYYPQKHSEVAYTKIEKDLTSFVIAGLVN